MSDALSEPTTMAVSKGAVVPGCVRLTDFLLYGLDATGKAVFSERLGGHDRAALTEIARARLLDWPGVEIWEGPLCVLRIQRAKPHY